MSNTILKNKILELCQQPISMRDLKYHIQNKGVDIKPSSIYYMVRQLRLENRLTKIEYADLMNLKICYYVVKQKNGKEVQ